MSFPFTKGRLKKAIERGLSNGELSEELDGLGELTLKSRSDGEAVCWGLEQLGERRAGELGEDVYALAALFLVVRDDDCEAVEVLRDRGIPELLRLYDEIQKSAEVNKANKLLLVLRTLALYGTTNGTLKVIEAAREPLEPGGYLWTMVLGSYRAGHPQNDLLFSSLRDPLPPDFIGVSLLDAANAVLMGGERMAHPFDTAEGKQRLSEWLANVDSGADSHVFCATEALPFISNPERDELLDLAMKHAESGVRVEAAWVAAKLGREDGVARLVEYCRDFKSAHAAKGHLAELDCEDLIPAEANGLDFMALAEFAQWLSHPGRLGRAPDTLEIIDHRELAWPPERESKPFWLMKYTARDTTGLGDDDAECGLVGSVTFCLFSYTLVERPPEDAYAIHCYWEMEAKGLIEESDASEEPGEYDNLIQQWSGPALENLEMLRVVEMSPGLKYPQRLLGLASARRDGEDGWVVLDGIRSAWYPRSAMPRDIYQNAALKVHAGRYLLGFTGRPDRRKYLAAPKPPKSPDQIITAYQKLLADAQQARRKGQEEGFGFPGPLSIYLEQYADALARSGRAEEVRAVIELLTPHWDCPGGWTSLGNAAYEAGQLDLAEHFFLKCHGLGTDYDIVGDVMIRLAEIWGRSGKLEAARALLVDCLRRLLEESKSAIGTDKRVFEDLFQNHRNAFLQLFPADGAAHLEGQGVPSSTLGRR